MSQSKSGLRVHIAALSSQLDVFWVTEERFDAACSRHPELASKLSPDWSWDLVGFDKAIRDAEILIGWRFGEFSIIENAHQLRWIQLTGAGTEHLQPLDWLPHKTALTNNAGVHGPKLAEFAGTAILMLNNDLPHFVTHQRQKEWSKKFTTTIDGKTLLIVGLGGAGGAVARWVKTKLGLRIIGVRRSGRSHRYADVVVRPENLDEVLPQADFIVITAPLTKETENLFDRRRLSLMKSTAGLVNLGRARIVNYEGLRECLDSGHLSGAVLDVFDQEPLPESSPLWSTRNLVAVPHCSSDDA